MLGFGIYMVLNPNFLTFLCGYELNSVMFLKFSLPLYKVEGVTTVFGTIEVSSI